MHSSHWSEKYWGHQAKIIYLFGAAILLLFGMLGSREIWTQEHRWADIITAMFYYHDFLHPMLDGADYYDKPLLSYWLMAGLSALMGHVNTWALRLPSAVAGLLAIWSIYRLGTNIQDRRLGLLSGWLLLTSFYFIFWARVSSADMLNMAGTLFAVAWYADHRQSTSLFHYLVFFLSLSVTALCKGLVGPVVVVLAIVPDMILQNTWKKHINWRSMLAVLLSSVIYTLPFWASSHFGNQTIHYQENGLMLVYRENVMRYFQPFDHKGPIYTYLIYLPVYLLPWAFFFIPALFFLKSRWKNMTPDLKWIVYATALIFLFFTLSGSRRSYYVLPMVPFAILLTADWILSGREGFQKRYRWAGKIAIVFYICFALNFIVFQPLYYGFGGVTTFNKVLQSDATNIKPWSQWNFIMLDPASKTRFYLQLSPEIKNLGLPKGSDGSIESLRSNWAVLQHVPKDTIIITRQHYKLLLQSLLTDYTLVEAEPTLFELLTKKSDPNSPIAFIPKNV